MKILNRYILSELAGPFLLSLALLTFILFMRSMVGLFPKIAGKDLDWLVIAEVLGLSLPFILALVLPMAVLVAVIMAFGRLSADNEITAFKSLGLSLHRLLRAPLAAALVLTLAAIWFNDRVLPEANHRYKNLLLDIAYLRPTLSLSEGAIMDEFPGLTLMVNRIRQPSGGGKLALTAPEEPAPAMGEEPGGPAELFGVVINQDEQGRPRRTIVADSGLIRFTSDRRDALLVLWHGEVQELDQDNPRQLQRTFFTEQRIRLPGVGSELQRGRAASYRSDREMSIGMMQERIAEHRAEIDSLTRLAAAAIDSLAGAGDSLGLALRQELGAPLPRRLKALKAAPPALELLPRDPNRPFTLAEPVTRLASLLREAIFLKRRVAALEVEQWKKLSIPFASLVFVLLGAPMGVLARRGGAGVSISLSLGVFLFYWIFLISGETLADRLLISPFWGMWAVNALFLALGLWLLVLQVHGRRSPGQGLHLPDLLRRLAGRRREARG